MANNEVNFDIYQGNVNLQIIKIFQNIDSTSKLCTFHLIGYHA